MTLPETVRIARANVPAGTAIAGSPFKMTLGDNEVALLHALNYWWYGGMAAGANTALMGLWKQTELDAPGFGIHHDNMLWDNVESMFFATESVVASGKDFITFPGPLVLIRPPRLMAMRITFVTLTVEMRLFYTIKRISDKELAELMVKDHA